MKIIFSGIFFLTQVSLFSQFVGSKTIDPANCRDGENVEYCKTHKLMNKLKKDPEAYQAIFRRTIGNKENRKSNF